MENEKMIKNSPDPISISGTKTILDQAMNCICKLKINNTYGTGFFCIIPLNDKELKVLMTNYHVLDEIYYNNNEELYLFLNDDKVVKVIKFGNDKNDRIKYFNKEYDLTLIEIKENDDIKNYLELDDNLFKDESKAYFKDISIYVLQYPLGKTAAVSYGLSIDIDNYEIKHLCSTEHGSSGSPILNLTNNKVIGIHKQGSKSFNFNMGTLLKFPLNDFSISYKNISKFDAILDNLRDVYKPGKPKMNITFESSTGFRNIVEVSYGTTIEQLLRRYSLRFLNSPDLVEGKNCCFVHNAVRINFRDNTPVEKFFKSQNIGIVFHDLNYPNYGWNEEEMEQLLLQEEKICPEIRSLPKPLLKREMITIKFNDKVKVFEIKISNYSPVKILIVEYLREANRSYDNIKLIYNNCVLKNDDFSSLYEIGLKNNAEIIVNDIK